MFKLEISNRVIIFWRILVSCRGFFEDYIFAMVKYLSFHNSSFALRRFCIGWDVSDSTRCWRSKKFYVYGLFVCLFVCFAGGSSSCNNFASVGRRLSAWKMNASWCLPQDNTHLGFALPPPCHHHNLCFRQRKLRDSLQKKWLISIGYPETGK